MGVWFTGNDTKGKKLTLKEAKEYKENHQEA